MGKMKLTALFLEDCRQNYKYLMMFHSILLYNNMLCYILMFQSGIVALSATTCIKVIETQWGLFKNIYLFSCIKSIAACMIF